MTGILLGTLAGVLLMATFATIAFIEYKHKQWGLRELKEERGAYTQADFVRFFEAKGVNPSIPENVYSYLQSLVGVRNFPVQPEDDLGDVFGVGRMMGVGLDELIAEIAGEIGVSVPDESEVARIFAELPWKSKVEDLVSMFQVIYDREHASQAVSDQT